MKAMTISCRMRRADETTEDAVTLPMLPEYAQQIMSGEAVEHLDYPGPDRHWARLRGILQDAQAAAPACFRQVSTIAGY